MAVGGYIRRMWRKPSVRRRLSPFVVVALAALAFAAPAFGGAAQADCADAVLRDWTKGVLGPDYAPECYDRALDALPEDLRAYTTAADDITRASIEAIRASSEGPAGSVSARRLAESPPANDELRSYPLEVALLAGLLAVLLSSGLVAALARRRRGR